MAILSKPAFGPAASLIYITSGTLLDVWTVVWYLAFGRGEPMTSTAWFWLAGLFMTGLVLVVIGVLLGQIGRAARKAELPPTEVVGAEAQIQNTAAAAPHPVMQQPVGAAPVATVVPPQVQAPAQRNTTTPPAPVVSNR